MLKTILKSLRLAPSGKTSSATNNEAANTSAEAAASASSHHNSSATSQDATTGGKADDSQEAVSRQKTEAQPAVNISATDNATADSEKAEAKEAANTNAAETNAAETESPENKETKKDGKDAPTDNGGKKKTKVHNLIIVDESGSMGYLQSATMSGINETISTIRAAQKEFADTQQHFITLVTFDSKYDNRVPAVRTIIDNAPALKVKDFHNYNPEGCTPLYDAIGFSVNALHSRIKDDEDATGVVTILTDGLENSSKEWTSSDVRRLIEQLKEEGWTFSYMGSAHDVRKVTDLLSIDHAMEFSHDIVGAENTWKHESASKHAYYCRMSLCDDHLDYQQKREFRKKISREYYGNRVTPDHITQLNEGEILVYGIRTIGEKLRGETKTAIGEIIARSGMGTDIRSHSYAISTKGDINDLRDEIREFIGYAERHPQQHFLVTQIGFDKSFYSPTTLAELFRGAVRVENISLPEVYWREQGLTFHKM